MMAYYLHDLSPFIIEFGNGMGIRWYGMSYVMAFVCGWLLYRHLARKGWSDLKPEETGDFIFACGIFGVLLGGRSGYVLFYRPDMLLQEPLSIFKVWEGGMSSHGGILGLVFFTLIYARWKKVSWLNLGDNLVVVAPIGLFFGRCANFINGELFGRPSTLPWAMYFPQELESYTPALQETMRQDATVREAVIAELQPRHPSQIYEALVEGALLFAVLWWMRTRCRMRDGALTGWFFVLYAVGRISVESMREPDAEPILGMTRGQFYSIFLALIGIAFLLASWKLDRVRAQKTRNEPQP